MPKPFFSVVIPTRDRAEHLRLAIQSVLNQTFGDFEIIISDNHSADETPEIAKEFGDPRIKYFRSPRPLSIGESFEFAQSNASGEYITFLSDDDAYAKVFLETFDNIISKEKAEIVTCNLTHYHAAGTFEYGRQIPAQSLVIAPYSRRLVVLDRKEAVRSLFSSIRLAAPPAAAEIVRFPQLVNSAYHNSLFKKVKERIPRIFPVLGSDIYSTALFFNLITKYCYIDEPLCLYCIWHGSETANGHASFQKYPDECQFDYVPVKKLITSPNYITNIILRARSDWGEDYLPIELDWSEYFVARFQEIKYSQANGDDVSAQVKEFEEVLSTQNDEVRRKVSRLRSSSTMKNFLRARFKKTPLGTSFLKRKYRKVKILSSGKNDFGNIAECAAKVDEDFLAKYAFKGELKIDNKWI
jgi:glycosyltransferase involved in cell wall biosynthesis